jgi:hypothetical protein
LLRRPGREFGSPRLENLVPEYGWKPSQFFHKTFPQSG